MIIRARKSVGPLMAVFQFVAMGSLHAQRPSPGEMDVAPKTSFFFQLQSKTPGDRILPESISMRLEAPGEKPVDLVRPGRKFGRKCAGSIAPLTPQGDGLAVNIQRLLALKSATTYTLTIGARTAGGGGIRPEPRPWWFVTESPLTTLPVSFALDLRETPVQWHGGFFSGIFKPSFCTSAYQQISSYELMDKARQTAPKAWSLQRDCFVSGFEYQPNFPSWCMPNIVRERETRRIKAIEKAAQALRLSLEDFFGHEQYGIPGGRPVSEDYHRGDEVLIADGLSSTRTLVLEVDDATTSVLVERPEIAAMPWKIAYSGALPAKEDPNAPGLFPPGGCYLRKFKPAGTPHYYWGRLDKEFDITWGRFKHRLIVNFIDAPGDLACNGTGNAPPKDYVEYHDAIRTITSHMIERYGDGCLEFLWCIFNEPDLMSGPMGFKNWTEIQRFYDYSVDAILRAFEDHGYDSKRVFVGGLELGAIFGIHLTIDAFLAHCSPHAESDAAKYGFLVGNAAFADERLQGKRSRRVEELCGAHGGKGSPCDYVSIHCYEIPEMAAAKMIRAKEQALEIDPGYYAKLWVGTNESCLSWNGSPDWTVGSSFLENGYFAVWCADVAGRLLRKTAEDARYGYGESVLTIWPWPVQNFEGQNGVTRGVMIDENGDGKMDRGVTLPTQVFNFLNLLSTMGDDYWVLPAREIGRHVVAGFASRGDKDLRLLLYSVSGRDYGSASDRVFDAAADLKGIEWPKVRVRQYQLDKVHNSYHAEAKRLAQKRPPGQKPRWGDERRVKGILRDLEKGDPAAQIKALQRIAEMGSRASKALPAVVKVNQSARDPRVHEASVAAFVALLATRPAYTPEEIRPVEEKAELRETAVSIVPVGKDGLLSLQLPVAANGVNFVIIEPAAAP